MHEKAHLKKSAEFVSLELATLTKKRFSDSKWIYEKKFDGIRCLAVCKEGSIKLYSRNRNVLNAQYPEIVQALKKMGKRNFVIDGEICAITSKESSFSALQRRMHVKSVENVKRKVPVKYFVFDLLYVNGYDVKKLPLIERKKLLKKSLRFNNLVKYTAHRVGMGESYFKTAQKQGWEGIIAKRADSTYKSRRTTDWLKFKCSNQQELVICGFTKPQGSRVGFGALLMGYYDKGYLKYAGKVGTGYNTELLSRLGSRLKRLERDSNPFKNQKIHERNIHWVSPSVVAQVEFTEWTPGGKLRHPSFLGLRSDKSAKSVKRERAK
ncbi:MAG: hypothetical protein K940chlam8_00700 [Chlamydiae bacterium]|nr:hypothetical protein [Chlamydiota bacterium]